ncbi:MAG TPA: YIP1 family protein [Candidatus Obscuribacter sp.]|nr:YIP1 family protein [Candidatus Obscuribacter sp.]
MADEKDEQDKENLNQGNRPDLFAGIPGYTPHGFGQPTPAASEGINPNVEPAAAGPAAPLQPAQPQSNGENNYPQLKLPQSPQGATPVFPQLQLPPAPNPPAEPRRELKPAPYVRRSDSTGTNMQALSPEQVQNMQAAADAAARSAPPQNPGNRPDPRQNISRVPLRPDVVMGEQSEAIPPRGSLEELHMINQQFISNEYVPKTPPVIVPHQDPDKPWAAGAEPQFEFFAEEYEEALRKATRAREKKPDKDAPPTKPSVWQETFANVIQSQTESLQAPQPAAKTVEPAQQPIPQGLNGEKSALSETFTKAPPKEISRGAAALRAAGFYDRNSTNGDTNPQPDAGFRMNRQDLVGILAFNLLTAKNILQSPRVFFSKMPTDGTLAEPLFFLLVVQSSAAILRCIFKFSLTPIFAELVMGLISAILGAALLNFVFQQLGGKGNFNAALRVVCYGKAPILISFLALGKLEIGIFAALCYTMYLNYLGFTRVYRKPKEVTLLVVIVMAVLGSFFRMGAP